VLGIPLRAVQVAPAWFLAQYTFTLSLAHTSVTSNTILSSSSSMFTLLASALVLRERVTAAKLASVAAVMAGAPHAAGLLLQAWLQALKARLAASAESSHWLVAHWLLCSTLHRGAALGRQLLLAWHVTAAIACYASSSSSSSNKCLSPSQSAAGTALVTLADGSASGDASQNLLGDALCVLSALLYSAYTVALQAQLRHDSPEAPALFFGVIGCMTAALGLPLLSCGQLLGWVDVRGLQPQALALTGINGEYALL
jgi:drug/metabolite transporter (DMT)-like permease